MSKTKFKLDPNNESAEGVYNTLMRQSNNFLNDKNLFDIKRNRTDQYTENIVGNLCISIANHCKMGKITNLSTKHVNWFVQDMQTLGYPEKYIKDAVSRLQDFSRKIGTKKTLASSKEIFKMNNVGKRKEVKLERQWSDAEYNSMIMQAAKLGREDVILAFKISNAFGTRLEGTMTLSPKQIERALVHGELVVTEKGGKTRHIKVETNKQKKLLKKIQKIYKTEKLGMESKIFRDSKYLNENKKIKNENSIGKCMKSVQNFISKHRDCIQDSDRLPLKDRNGESIEKPELSFHGLRYRNAQELYVRKRLEGKSIYQAMQIVNEHLGHGKNRWDITKVYLKNIEKQFINNLDFYKEKYRYN